MASKQQGIVKTPEGRVCIEFTKIDGKSSLMRDDVLAGLQRYPKQISPKYLYDERGSSLFDLICNLPEYYPTRTEISILKRYGKHILTRLDGDVCLIELGAGSCRKSSLLLDTGAVSSFVPVDICGEFLWQSTIALSDRFPQVRYHAIAMDFLDRIGLISSLLPTQGTRLIFFAGSSIGNFDPDDAVGLLSQFHQLLRGGDGVLIGYDLPKAPQILHRAYNDVQEITAAFNLNLLARLNRELLADFDQKFFRHVAFYNAEKGRIEMHLESTIQQDVSIGGKRFPFNEGERIHTESSYKYTIDGFDTLAGKAGLERAMVWTDADAFFALGLYVPKR